MEVTVRETMNKEEVLKIIKDVLINPKLDYYYHEYMQSQKGLDYDQNMSNNIKMMYDLEEYIKENLK